LIPGVIGIFEQDTSINIDVEGQVLYLVVHDELPIVERELAQVVRGLWVVGVKGLDDLLVLLLCGQLLLVDAAHICLVHDEIIFVLDVIRDLLLDNLVLLSLFLQGSNHKNQ
jgi:hypothetical protein